MCTSEDSDQPGHPLSLIRVFRVCMKKALVLSYPLTHSEDADQTGQMPRLICLRWAHNHFVGFVMRQLVLWGRNAICMLSFRSHSKGCLLYVYMFCMSNLSNQSHILLADAQMVFHGRYFRLLPYLIVLCSK